MATNITMSEEADSTYHAYRLYEFSHDVIAWTEFMADVIEKGTFKLGSLEDKSKLGFAGAREALDELVYVHKVPYRYAHRVCGELVRLGTEGLPEQEVIARISERLKDFPAIDAARLVHIATGESTEAIYLNMPAFEAVANEVRANLKAVSENLGPNPAQTAIDKLMAEAKALAG
ncbi:hypothetical protein [Rhizobium binxianense]